MKTLLPVLTLALLLACLGDASRLPGSRVDAPDAGEAQDAATPPDSGATPDAGQPDAATPDAGAPDAGPVLTDDAEQVSDTLPPQLTCQESRSAVLTVRNTGTTTWSKADGYRLGAVGDSDPLVGTTRLDLDDGETVAPGATRDFTLPLVAPATAGTVTTDWQMLRESVHWFGAVDRKDITVVPAVTAPPFDLATATIVSSPDVRSFPVTSAITNLTFSPGTIHIDHTKRGQWPGVVIDPSNGTTQEATIWVFFAINGTWYGTGGERLRPNQTDKQLTNPSDIGPGWLYDPNRWGVMTNYVPRPGDLVGFMVVAGSTRSDDNVIVQERTGVILVPFPADGVTTSFPPFAWQE